MRLTSCLLLSCAAAFAGEVDLAGVARVMEEREAATYPFVATYRSGDVLGTFAVDGTRRVWRGWRGEEEQLWTRYRGGWLRAWREPERILTEWRGEITDGVAFEWPVLPVDFGLEQASEPLSSFLRRPSARFAGNERVGKFDCIKVLVDWVHATTASIQHPLGLWLARGQSYYPVKVVVYGLHDGHERPGEDLLELDGRRFRQREWQVTTDLAVVGAALFPIEGKSRAGDMVVQMNTLKLGEVDDFGMPSYLYVRDLRRSHYLWITPAGAIRISYLWIALYLVAAVALGGGVFSVRRRLKLRHSDAMEWQREPVS